MAIGTSLHFLVRIPTHDLTNSFKMYKAEFLKQTSVESTGGFELGMELVVKGYAAGKKITEVPSTWLDRTAGKSRFRLWGWAGNYFHWYLYALKNGRVRRAA
jgi:dolichol-phosphate mannosyltransferase